MTDSTDRIYLGQLVVCHRACTSVRKRWTNYCAMPSADLLSRAFDDWFLIHVDTCTVCNVALVAERLTD